MPADTSVKYFHNGMAGAPTLSGTAGSLIAVLDACLVNGFGSGTVDSVVISGGIATVTRSTGHPFEVDSVAFIAGATVSGGSINGEKKVLSVTATTYTFDATGIANQTATGTITHKLAPANWVKEFSSTNLAVYKSADVASTGCRLRVDDTGTVNARVVGYETMSDVNTGTGPFPTSAQVSGGAYWTKSSVANSTSNNWILVADGRTIYFARAYRTASGTPNDYELTMFGDIASVKTGGDAFGCVLNANTSDQSGGNVNGSSSMYGISSTNIWMPRAYTGLGSSMAVAKAFPNFGGLAAGSYSGGSTNSYMPYPNPTDGGLYLVPNYITENVGGNQALRGISPGLYGCPQNLGTTSFANKDSVTGVTGLTGKKLKAICTFTGLTAIVFIDITGAWR